MATFTQATPPLAPPPMAGSAFSGSGRVAPQPTGPDLERETALAPVGHPGHSGPAGHGASEEASEVSAIPTALAGLPVGLSVAVPLREFRVRQLLALAPGEVIETQWGHGEDLPLGSGDVQLAWSEFEVIDTRLAVRITRLT